MSNNGAVIVNIDVSEDGVLVTHIPSEPKPGQDLPVGDAAAHSLEHEMGADLPEILPEYVEANEVQAVQEHDSKADAQAETLAFRAELERLINERDGLETRHHLLRMRNAKNEELANERAREIVALKRAKALLGDDLRKAQAGMQMAVQRQRDFEIQLEDSLRAWELLEGDCKALQEKHEALLEQYDATRTELEELKSALRAAIAVLSIFVPLLLVFRQFSSPGAGGTSAVY